MKGFFMSLVGAAAGAVVGHEVYRLGDRLLMESTQRTTLSLSQTMQVAGGAVALGGVAASRYLRSDLGRAAALAFAGAGVAKFWTSTRG